MIGSRQGWVEAPYVPVPPPSTRWLRNLVWTPARELAIVPGLISRDGGGVPDVMRGEETQLAGAVAEDDAALLAVLPGTHSKWAQRRGRPRRRLPDAHDRRALRRAARAQHPRAAREAQRATARAPGAAFAHGVARGLAGGGLGHAIFGARTLALTGELDAHDVPEWLSGVLIGHEIGAARQWARRSRRGRNARAGDRQRCAGRRATRLRLRRRASRRTPARRCGRPRSDPHRRRAGHL